MNILGLAFSALQLEEVRDLLLARPEGTPFAYIATPNVDHLDRLRRYPALKPAYDAAWLRLFDSRFLAHVLRFLGQSVPPVVTGADLITALLPYLDGQCVAVVGLSQVALSALRVRYPDICFLHYNPPMGLLGNRDAFAAAVRFVREADANFTFFAVGSPTQELLAFEVMQAGDARGIGLCVGAALEFAAGTRRRAPRWIRCAGLEWLFRLALEPRRLAGRYLVRGPWGLAVLLAQASGFRPKSGG